MKNKTIVAPSLLAADFRFLDKELSILLQNRIGFLHFDVMDGHFVPNLSFGIPLLEALKPHYNFVYDVHVMISNPDLMVEKYIKAGADIITFHYEACKDDKAIFEIIKEIKGAGVKAGLSIKPNTSVEVLKPFLKDLDLILVMSVEPGFGGQSFMPSAIDKIAQLSSWKKENNYGYLIEVDGGINGETGKACRVAGAEVLVAGSYLFGKEDIADRIRGLRNE